MIENMVDIHRWVNLKYRKRNYEGFNFETSSKLIYFIADADSANHNHSKNPFYRLELKTHVNQIEDCDPVFSKTKDNRYIHVDIDFFDCMDAWLADFEEEGLIQNRASIFVNDEYDNNLAILDIQFDSLPNDSQYLDRKEVEVVLLVKDKASGKMSKLDSVIL